MSDTVVLKLNPEAYRMARSQYRLFQHIAHRDAKAVAAVKPHLIIFPTSDTALQAAITLVAARLANVINR